MKKTITVGGHDGPELFIYPQRHIPSASVPPVRYPPKIALPANVFFDAKYNTAFKLPYEILYAHAHP